MGGALRSGTSVEWWTPPHIFEALDLDFDLDPCAPPEPAAPWIPARARFTAAFAESGLDLPWAGRIWLNPPYGREAGDWVAKLARHARSEHPTDEGIALVFVRTCARWGQAALSQADAVCFIAGRLSFIDGTDQDRKGHNAANGSMLLAYGPKCAEAVLNCGLGVVLAPSLPSQNISGDQEGGGG
jgi:hypothetical protein